MQMWIVSRGVVRLILLIGYRVLRDYEAAGFLTPFFIQQSESLSKKFGGFYFIFKFGILGLLHHVVTKIADRIRELKGLSDIPCQNHWHCDSKESKKGNEDYYCSKEKDSITVDDNIVLDPEEVLKLGKSISRAEADEQEEARWVHQTHERLVTKKSTSNEESDDEQEGRLTRRKPIDVVIRDTLNISMKKILDQCQKFKGIAMLLDVAQLASDTQKAIKASRHEIISYDDERTESEKEAVESKKAVEEAANEEEVHSDKEVHTKEEDQTNDEAHNDEYVYDDDEKHKDADKDMNDAENIDEAKDYQEMVDAEKVNFEKTKEEKVNEEQIGVNQAKYKQTKDIHAEDDQVGALVFVAQKEKPEVPPSSSSLSLSSENEIPPVLSSLLLDVLVSMIPPQTTLTLLPTPLISSEAPTVTTSIPDLLLVVIQILSDLERKFKAWTKVDHSEAIEASVQNNVINIVKNQLPKLLPKVVSDFIYPRIKSTVRDVL
ncbi:hypothetical protein Tco_1554561 [Tanacetum coccineum]